MLWEDVVSGEAVESHVLEKDNKSSYSVPHKEVFLTRLQTGRDVSALQLSCGWSRTVPCEDEPFIRVDVQASGTLPPDLVCGSFKPCSVLIWNGRNLKREQFAEAVTDICGRNFADIMFAFNTGMNGDGILKEMVWGLPYDAEFCMPEQGQTGGLIVLWNSRTVNVMCGSWKVGGEGKSWISVISRYDEDELW
ncbi:hypothetical protein SLA2020_247710 [Shorea laevis]